MRSTAVVLLFILLAGTAMSQSTGTIRGKVTDEDGFTLNGANVYIKELRLGAATDQNGEFTLIRVPSGTHSLIISYIGFRSETRDVKVQAGTMTEISVVLQSGVVRGEEIVVVGERLRGQAKSLNQQRNNANITNIVSADQIGRFPDANIGDALKRIPSITVSYDMGEARSANIRGMEPRLNSIMINGERIPSAEGSIRAVQLDLVPAAVIQSIEVNKAVTPEMDADAIGGSVNLVTRGAPSDLRVSGTLGSGYNMLSEKPIWIGSAILGTRLLDDRLGMVVSASWHDHFLGSHNAEGEWAMSDDNSPYVKEWDVRRYDVQRIRRSVSAGFDYHIDPANTLFLRGIYNHRDDWENRFRLRYRLSEPVDGVSEVTEIRRQTKGGIGDDRIDNTRLEDQRVMNFSLAGEHLFGGLVKMNWSGAWSKASEERPHERYIQWRVRGVPVRVDISDPSTPYPIPVNESDVALSAFRLHEITEEYQYTEEIDMNARLDLEIPLTTIGEYKNSLKFGGRFRGKDKNRDNRYFEYEPVSGLENMVDSELKDYTIEDYLAGDYRSGFFTSTEYLGSLDLDNPSLFEKIDVPEEYAPENYIAREHILAGYAQLNQNIGDRLFLIAGLRMEHTTIDYDGFEFNDETEQIRATTGSDNYSNFLPGVHLKYSLTKNTILRAAWSNTIARPNYYDLVPYRNIAVEDQELYIGNPGLNPTTSMNVDLMAENYFESIGILSGGLFYKDLTDFIYIYSERDYVDPISGDSYLFFQPRNGAAATLYGFEFAYQRQLNFLPGMLRNLGIYSNYTYTASTTDNPDFGERDIELPGAAPHSLNAALTYQDSRTTIGVSFNYSSPYLDPNELDLTPGLERYYDAVTYLDVNASFAITSQLRIFLEANNLLNQPLRFYAGDSNRTAQAEYYNRRFTAGIKFDL